MGGLQLSKNQETCPGMSSHFVQPFLYLSALHSPGHSAEALLSKASLYLGYPGPSLPSLTGDGLFQ